MNSREQITNKKTSEIKFLIHSKPFMNCALSSDYLAVWFVVFIYSNKRSFFVSSKKCSVTLETKKKCKKENKSQGHTYTVLACIFAFIFVSYYTSEILQENISSVLKILNLKRLIEYIKNTWYIHRFVSFVQM